MVDDMFGKPMSDSKIGYMATVISKEHRGRIVYIANYLGYDLYLCDLGGMSGGWIFHYDELLFWTKVDKLDFTPK
jgi:hypothetical protein